MRRVLTTAQCADIVVVWLLMQIGWAILLSVLCVPIYSALVYKTQNLCTCTVLGQQLDCGDCLAIIGLVGVSLIYLARIFWRRKCFCVEGSVVGDSLLIRYRALPSGDIDIGWLREELVTVPFKEISTTKWVSTCCLSAGYLLVRTKKNETYIIRGNPEPGSFAEGVNSLS